MAIIRVSEETIITIGLQTVGCSESWKSANTEARIETFRACFYATPKTCQDIFVAIQADDLETHRVKKPDLVYLLITLNWLYKYNTEKQMSINFKINEKTIRKNIWRYAEAINALKTRKVSHTHSS